tara:strand:+ start:830 stop:2032 length:1203 start_codon:yes stop_codon:yes gene_type:complete
MNIIQQEDKLKSLPDSNLENEMVNPTGMFPQYLVMSEIQRRQEMRKDYEGRIAANEKTPPLPSMREQMMAGITQQPPMMQDSGIAGLLPAQPQRAPIPPAMPAGPDAIPMYGGGVVRMQNLGEVPNPYDVLLKQLREKTEEEKEFDNLYEELMAEQPEKLREEKEFSDGLNLMKAGLTLGTAGTFKELSSGLEKTINSIDASNKAISEKKDKMKKLQLEKAKLDIDREAKIKDRELDIIKSKDTAESMKDMYLSTAVKTSKYLQSPEGQALKVSNPTLYETVKDSIDKSSAGSDWFTELKTKRGAEILASYDASLGGTITLDNEIKNLYNDENLVITNDMRDKYISDRVSAQLKRDISILTGAIPELIALEAKVPEQQYSGGVVGKSVQDFNDVVKIING